MKQKQLKLVLTLGVTALTICVWYATRGTNAIAVDFDTSMRLSQYPQALKNHETEIFVYKKFKQLYDKNYVAEIAPDAPYKIPRIMHHIWLGSPFPEKYKAWFESWSAINPEWEHRLWTDADVDAFGLVNREQYDYAKNYGEKSDIARYEILYRLGGVYLDTDYECVKPLDDLHKAYSFYIGIQPLDTTCFQLGIGIMGAVPGHPLLRNVIQAIGKKKQIIEAVIKRTGPIFFTQMFYHYIEKLPADIIALPASFLYPQGYSEKNVPMERWLRPESYAIHHWGGSWLAKEAFVKEWRDACL